MTVRGAGRRGAGRKCGHQLLQFVEATSVLLFWLQALRVIFAGMFGIVYDQTRTGPIGPWLFVSSLLVLTALLAPALLVSANAPIRSNRRRWLALFAVVAAFGRLVISAGGPNAQFWGSLLALSGGTAYLGALIRVERRKVLPGLLAALVLDQCLRAAGDTYDLSLRPGWLPVQILWSLLLVITSLRLELSARTIQNVGEGLGHISGLALGGALFLETSLLSLPNAVARWSDESYTVIAPALVVVTILPLFPVVRHSLWAVLSHGVAARLAAGSSLAAAVMAGYFASGPFSALALLTAHAAALSVLVCILDGSSRRAERSSERGLALGLLLLVSLGLLSALTFTYPYTLPLMRGLGWAVYLAAALLAGTALLSRRQATSAFSPSLAQTAWVSLGSALAVAISIVAVWPQSALPMPATGTLRIATYNIHYGYNESWDFRLEEIARTIEHNGVDIIALQEVDAGRLTSYGVDDAYYLARRLRMNVVYLPTVEHLTGIALLYHGPSEGSDWSLLTSRKEQTGIVHAQLPVDDSYLHAFGTWIGLSDENTQVQIGEALEFMSDRIPAIYAGDFNAQPGSQIVQAIEAAGFVDPFVALGVDPPPFTSPAIKPDKRIDYVWLRDLIPVNAWVPESAASDHRMVVAEVQRPR